MREATFIDDWIQEGIEEGIQRGIQNLAVLESLFNYALQDSTLTDFLTRLRNDETFPPF